MHKTRAVICERRAAATGGAGGGACQWGRSFDLRIRRVEDCSGEVAAADRMTTCCATVPGNYADAGKTFCCPKGQRKYGDGSACRGGTAGNYGPYCSLYGNAMLDRCATVHTPAADTPDRAQGPPPRPPLGAAAHLAHAAPSPPPPAALLLLLLAAPRGARSAACAHPRGGATGEAVEVLLRFAASGEAQQGRRRLSLPLRRAP